MNTATVIMSGGTLLAGLWALHQLGKGVTWLLEVLAVIAAVFIAFWLAVKAIVKATRWVVLHWRTTVAVLAVAVWCAVWGWRSLAVGVSWTVEVLGVWWLVAWRIGELAFFDAWAGRHLRGWW